MLFYVWLVFSWGVKKDQNNSCVYILKWRHKNISFSENFSFSLLLMKHIALGVLVVLSTVLLAGCAKSTDTAATPASEGVTQLAQCLTEKWVKMFGTERCSHCKNQKSKFGEAFSKVTYIDCDAQKSVCTSAGIQGYPTWVDAAGKQYPGDQPLEQLATIGGCTYTP